jgi:transposase
LNLVKESDSERSGVYTTNLTIETNKNTIVLYYTKNKHAGENLEELLKLRTVKDKIIKMSDALSSNNVKTETIECNCLVHARRKFVEIKDYWPKEASYVIQLIQKIYKNEKEVKKEEMNDAERLLYHQKHSLPIMVEYKRYIEELLIKNKIEPNSSFGAAINYSLNHWENLTRFLSVPGAPIDNNEAERKLKIPIRTRKNSLFYYNLHGALIGSMLMSIIATCLAAGVNAIKYLTELQKNREKVLKNPEAWMPWNFDPMEVS